jgi:hypothetical protein
MRGRMFVSGALLAALVTLLSGCGTEEAACFEGPAVTYTARFVDYLRPELPVAGTAMCHVMEGRTCQCSVSDAIGYAEFSLPAGEEVMTRVGAEGYVPFYSFHNTPATGSTLLQYRMASVVLANAYADFVGVDMLFVGEGASMGVAVAEAHGAGGASMEGTAFELLEPSGVTAEADGPFYNDFANEGLPQPEASSSVGLVAHAIWLNVSPGRYFVRGTTATGDALYERCGRVSGWRREIGGEVALQMDVFAGHVSPVTGAECEP